MHQRGLELEQLDKSAKAGARWEWALAERRGQSETGDGFVPTTEASCTHQQALPLDRCWALTFTEHFIVFESSSPRWEERQHFQF